MVVFNPVIGVQKSVYPQREGLLDLVRPNLKPYAKGNVFHFLKYYYKYFGICYLPRKSLIEYLAVKVLY